MEKEQKIEKIKPKKEKKRIWNRILIYVVCLVIAIAVWMVASYETWYKEHRANEDTPKEDTNLSETAAYADPFDGILNTVLYG